MKEITIKAYTFDELSDAAKEKARDWYRETYIDDISWSEFVIEEAVTQGRYMGINFRYWEVPLMSGKTRQEPAIYWRGFSSQGDGACFEGTWYAQEVQIDKVAEGWGDAPETTEIKRIASAFADIAKQFPSARFTVRHRGHYYHEHCTDFDFDSGVDDPEANPDDFPESELKEAAKDYMRYIYRQLEKEWEYRISDECVDEQLRNQEHLFTEQGYRRVILE